jgi:galactarate dehydratase
MVNPAFASETPRATIGGDVRPEDMAKLSEADWSAIRTMARKYCRVVSGTRSRNLMDGNATCAGGPFGRYGTADISDDVTQDAILIFARNLAQYSARFQPASLSVATREPDSWLYETRDGRVIVADRKTIMAWSVREAGRRNGYRIDEPPDDIDATPGTQLMRELDRAMFVAVGTSVAGLSDVIWATAWGDGQDFPVLDRILTEGSTADDIGRAPILANVSQAIHGGKHGSWRPQLRTRETALAEFHELRERLDDARDMLVYQSARRDHRPTGALPDD